MKIKDIIRILKNPSCWDRNYPTSKALSKKINDLLDANTPLIIGKYSAIELGNLVLWANNFPYAFGTEYPFGESKLLVMPDRTTVFRLYDAYNKAFMENYPKMKIFPYE